MFVCILATLGGACLEENSSNPGRSLTAEKNVRRDCKRRENRSSLHYCSYSQLQYQCNFDDFVPNVKCYYEYLFTWKRHNRTCVCVIVFKIGLVDRNGLSVKSFSLSVSLSHQTCPPPPAFDQVCWTRRQDIAKRRLRDHGAYPTFRKQSI